MPIAREVAIELRKVSDALDRDPEAVVRRPVLGFYCNEKEEFINLARLLPRPLKKAGGVDIIQLENEDRTNLILVAEVPRSLVCELVEPAKPAVYRCEPLLSMEEEETLV